MGAIVLGLVSLSASIVPPMEGTLGVEAHTYFVGDSVGVTVDIGADWHDSFPGRTLEQGYAILPETIPGDTIVIELGTNNLNNPETWVTVDYMLDAIPRGVCVWWVTPYSSWWVDQVEAFRTYLYQTVLPQQCGGIIDWARFAQPEWVPDTVHPNPIGSWALSLLIDSHVRALTYEFIPLT
jgi:hypothetical protein